MHEFRFTHRRLRRTVWVTLMAWIFALSAGVANACALGLSLPAALERASGDPAVSAPMASADGWHLAADPAYTRHGTHPGGDHEHGQGQAGCQKFCDDESSAVTKSPSAGQDVGPAMAFVVELRGAILPRPNLVVDRWLDRPSADGPPLAIRFLRLTL